ncbi:type I polyketide synthase [Nocardia sp. CS682]|uniref:type I polyketide synthase n=1 Tax=Nocardia sp. CS682 TaxID=1047172 RepID=UPI0010756DAB|nr:type I polyketide synthase [Nocardia sp. CS682]QBS39349.1 3-ketoacyl-ACP reductase [Nocardia sp. CS682]
MPLPIDGDIAVVGIACRFPGAASPDALWSLLTSGTAVETPVPDGRWAPDALAGVSEAEADIIRRGAFLDDVAGFDADFFRVSPAEAAMMDPQQRLMLELSWEALEDAGIPDRSVAGTRAGVFVGVAGDDYTTLVRGRGADTITPYTFTGSQRSIVANRVSYFLQAKGPSLIVDAGQASSLVAVHLAAASLRRDECSIAIAGGVNLRLTPHHAIAAHRIGALSPDGRCHVFDARANGFAQGEGGGAVVLKPLAAALADGDDIYCVIRGSAVTNDGGGDHLSTPTVEGQAAAIRAAYRLAEIDPATVGNLELHGTGTAAGDPVEAAALGAVIGAAREAGDPLRVGSIKSNIGHLEAAAGIAGFIKAALCVRAGTLVPTADFRTPNPAIPLDALNLRVQTATEPMPDTAAVFGVSSFGVGGTNCHVAVSAPPPVQVRRADDSAAAPTPVPLVLSAASAAALRAQASGLAAALEHGSDLLDVGRSLITARSRFEHRAVVLAPHRDAVDAALDGLAAVASSEPAASVSLGRVVGTVDPVFVFPGQGSQWVGMAAELLDSSTVFAASIDRCANALSPFVDWSLTEVLRGVGPAASLDRVDVVQPALWAVMIALSDVWRSLGVRPAAVVGHSQGEIAAACVAGILSLSDGARVVALRSRIIATHLAGRGGMATVALSADELRSVLGDYPEVGLAALNGPRSVVVSGPSEPLERLLELLENRAVRVRRVPVDYASHSAYVDAVTDELLDALGPITPRAGEIAFHSTVTGGALDGTELTAAYWCRNLREPVLFEPVVTALLRRHATFIEPSPHAVLTVRVQETAEAAAVPVAAIGTLRRDEGSRTRLLNSAAEAWNAGVAIDWTTVLGTGTRRVPLPTYPFQRTHHWFDTLDAAVAQDMSALALRLREAGTEHLRDVLLDMVRRHTAVALGFDAPGAVEDTAPFRSQGLTSIVGATLCADLARATGVALPPTAVFDYPTPLALAVHLEERVRGTSAAAPVAQARAVADDDDPVVIVGMACRYPGGVSSPEELWRLVATERDVIGAFPADRGWDLDGVGASVTSRGGFLYDAAEFDAAFFGISPREALAMDPQQRLLLETAWEALERTGIDPQTLRGSHTGVFIGAMAQDYGPRLHEPSDGTDGYRLTGTTGSVASGRVAYALGLEGPAVTVDTACSSSLVALHLAAEAVRRGECSMALAGGVTVMSSPGIFVEFSRQGGLSPDGRCKAFADSADGTGWAEGVGLLLVERLSDARRNNHPVLAIVRGSAINQDGASNGLTAPNGPSQQRVIRQALASAGLRPADVDAVEAHGTGTRLGDPIEAQALLATYGTDRAQPLWLGSIKSNIGHSQAAAGVAGVIKMVMAMRHGVLPRTLHIDAPTTHVDWSAGAVRLLAEQQPWPEHRRPRRAGVSSFGISGTNAHVVLEQPPVEAPTTEPRDGATDHELAAPWLLSAVDETALRAQARQLSVYLREQDTPDPVAVGATLATARSVFGWRAAVFGANTTERAAALDALGAGRPHPELVRGAARTVRDVVFVFPGQGSQWAGMGAELLDSSPVFAESITRCEHALAPFVDWSLTEVLRTDHSALDRVDVVQPALWAIMVALTEVWRTLGIEPSAVIGHSQGEIAAATVAGILTLDDAARIVALRSKIIGERLAGHGGMASIALPAKDVEHLLTDHPGLDIAAHNGPQSTVVAGAQQPLAELLSVLEQRAIRVRRIPVDYASHTAHVDSIRAALDAALAQIAPRQSRIAFYSTVTGTRLDGTELTADYWFRNLRQTVLFHPVVESLLPTHTTFIEPSPHPVLTAAIQDTADAVDTAVSTVGTLRRDQGSRVDLLAAAAHLWAHGAPVDWPAQFPAARRIPLPTYPFQRSRYWLDSAVQPAAAESDDTGFWAAVESDDTDTVATMLGLPENRPDWLAQATPALARWREARRARGDLDALRYTVQWTPATTIAGGAPAGTWLVLAPSAAHEPAWAPAVRAALRAGGAQVVELRPGATDRAALRELLPQQVDGVLSLFALDETPNPGSAAVSAGTAATLTVVHALADAGFEAPLWILTSGAVTVHRTDGLRNPAQSQVWGLGRVVALEQPERWGGLVDVTAAPDDRAIERLLAVLAQRTEDQVAIRESGIFARRLVHATAAPSTASPVARDTVLITGGTGALGAHVARRFAVEGVRHLVLAGRRGPQAPGAEELAAELRSLGAEVSIVACDVGDRDAVAQLLDRFPVTSVVHAAGLLDDAVVDSLTVDQLDRVLRVKAEGARHLHELTAGLELAEFVLFSSISGVLGIPGQGGYAPGNAYLDALAEHRRGLGLPATSYAWGPWAGDGMAAVGGVEDRLRRHGVPPLAPDHALALLIGGTAADPATVMVADVRWDRFFLAYTEARRRPLIEALPEVRAQLDAGAGGRDDEAGSGLAARVRALPPKQRSAAVLEVVLAQIAAVLGHADPHNVEAEKPFQELGFDSLTGVELRNRLGAEADVRLPSGLVFDYPTAGAVARYLESVLVGADETEAPAALAAAGDEDPVVIVGAACRYPGGIDSPEGLWRLVADGGDAIGDLPTDRGWDLARLLPEVPGGPGTSVTGRGGFLHDAADFDAALFGISPREALAMDPQQRILLETAWEAFERAGLDPMSLHGSDTGVFVGMSYHDYQTRLAEPPQELAGYLLTGATPSVASGRISYTFGLEGPAVTIDTACSSSLVALHLAAEAVRRGECATALAGGIAIMSTPHMFTEFSRQQGLSPDGRCKAFAGDADGFGAAEGVGLLLVARLSEARRRGLPVLAVVRGSAVNQDGASNGLTAPNGPAQQRVIRQALANAGLRPDDVDAVEAHGTGTRLGDPIEAHALQAAYGRDRTQPLWLGSVKSNIGHTQAAAGAAGIIKMIMAMRHGVLPRTLHVDEPAPEIDWAAGQVRLLTEDQAWPGHGRPRRAAVSSFGVSGTNAHVVLEEPPVTDEPATPRPEPVAVPWVLSAKTAAALREQARRLLAVADRDPADIGWSLATTRAVLDQRAVIVGEDREQLLAGLTALANGTPAENVVEGTADAAGKIVFVFPGQGSQWAGMGAELLDSSPVFAESITRCEHALAPFVDWSLTEVLRTDHSALDRVDVVQPALWAIMVALTEVWRTLGIEPSAVIGHSQGEIAAATVAGILTLDDAARIVALRSKIIGERLAGHGGMASIALPAEDVEHLLTDHPGLDIAAHNGPQSTVVAGPRQQLEQLLTTLEQREVRLRRIPVDYASHTPGVEIIRAELEVALAPVRPRAGDITFYSTVTATPLDGTELTADYWFRNLRQPVLFHPTVETLVAEHRTVFIEPSPHPVLVPALAESGPAVTAIGTLRRADGGLPRLLTAAATAWTTGIAVDWAAQLPGARAIPLPTYPFQHTRYWMEESATGAANLAAAGQTPLNHPLLSARVDQPDGREVLLTGRISLDTHPWLADHAVGGVLLLPGTAVLELAVRAGDEVGCDLVEELTLTTPLVVPERGASQLRVRVASTGDGRHTVSVHARPEDVLAGDAWTLHASGTLTRSGRPAAATSTARPAPGAEPLPIDTVYERFAGHGYSYGPAFQGLRAVWRSGRDVFAEIALPAAQHAAAERFTLHPALLDAATQTVLLATPLREGAPSVLPFEWRNFSVHTTGATAAFVHLHTVSGTEARLSITDTAGVLIAEAEALVLRPVDLAGLTRLGAGRTDTLLRVEWSVFTPASVVPADIVSHVEVSDAAELAALAAAFDEDDAELPSLVFARLDLRPDERTEPSAAIARDEALRVSELLRHWLAEPLFDDSQLVLVTRHAVRVLPDDPAATRFATVWGLVASAQTEHPGRFVLADLDDAEDSYQRLPLAVAGGEPQIAVRHGRPRFPRLVPASEATAPAALIDPDGTVLITGGTGTLGRLVARQLIDKHGVRRLVLVSRQGPRADGATELLAELRAAGAQAEIVACDVADRQELTRLFEALQTTHPVTAVVHTAGTLADGVVESLTPEQLDTVLRPKVDAAVHLHELTERHDVRRLVLFSSAAGVLGSAGQAGYAAANAFLDALARYRRQRGVPAVALAWGLWDERSALTSGLTDADLRRLAGLGIGAMRTESALTLFDAAWRGEHEDAALVPLRVEAAALIAAGGAIPPLLRDLVRVPVRRAAARQDDDADPLADIPADRRAGALLDLVRARAAAVLGHGTPEAVPSARAFRDLGFDSLAAVELRNRLNTATGLRLPATIVFDHPNPTALAEHIEQALYGRVDPAPAPAHAGQHADDPVVVVAMSCRFPGGASTPEAYWQFISAAGDAVSAMPADRGWDPGAPREGAFLYDAAEFDPDLFGISPREALAMDPQQRLLLETSWELFERAGIDPMSLRGSKTGVFAGVMYHDYGARLTDVPADVEGYLINGSAGSVASGRVAYVFGLEGPAVTVDTACSSSLVAVHLAAQALRSGECSMALAGGVTIMATPAPFVEFSRQGGLAQDGRCKAFAATADGTGWGEGAGLLLLERLSDARRNGHPVLAILRGSSVNQDGASNGLTAPNGPSQQRVIRQALANAGLRPADIDAVEAHGTGTRLGDPIEAQALLATYGQERDQPLWLGSVKSNIGHTQAAAGAAGVIKMIMSMRHGILPRTLHIDQPTPEVDWDTGKVALLTENQPWPAVARPRRVGVSAFGVSGTNAHVILEQAPAVDTELDEPRALPVVPWLLSARGPAALRAQAIRLSDDLSDADSILDVGWSLATTRAALEDRAIVLVSDETDRTAALRALAEGTTHPSVITGRVTEGTVAMMFSGQGSQRLGMGRALYEAYPVYTQAFDEVCAHLDAQLPKPLRDIVFGADPDLLSQTGYAQPALFALQVALYRLWTSWGVTPAVVAGHSIGEVAAAHVAGVLDLADAATLIAVRGRLMQSLPEGGAMVAVEIAERDVLPLLDGYRDRIGIAAINSPNSLVLSGDRAALTEIGPRLDGHRTKWLRVSHAFHSPLMEPILDEFRSAVADLTFSAPQLPMVSTVTGAPIEDTTLADPEHWVRHARQAVRFADAVTAMAAFAPAVHVEIGPTATLIAHVTGTAVASLRHDRPEPAALATALAHLVVSGVGLDWHAYFAGTNPRPTPLPTYPFQRTHLWLDNQPAGSIDLGTAGLDSADHPILKAAVTAASSDRMLFTGRVSLPSQPWLADHTVHGAVLFPGTAFVDLALHAGRHSGYPRLAELVTGVPLVLTETEGVQIRVEVDEPAAGCRAVAVFSRPEGAEPDDPWTRHCDGVLAAAADERPVEPVRWPPADATQVDIADFYARMDEIGIGYGPAFRGLRAVWRSGEEMFASIRSDYATEGFAIHPALFDAALHATAVDAGAQANLPFQWSGVQLHGRAGSELLVRLVRRGPDEVSLDLADASGAALVSVASLVGRPVSADLARSARAASLRLDWQPVALPVATELPPGDTVLEVVVRPSDRGDLAESARRTAEQVLRSVQDWLARQSSTASRLLVVTEGLRSGDPDRRLPAAAVWGLVRSAQVEHPGRLVLVDTDGDASRLAAAAASGAAQLALRGHQAYAPRLVRHAPPAAEAVSWDGTVLVTGASGALGGLVAEHLVRSHGVRRLLLVSRRGGDAPGADGLAARLSALGAEVAFAACDVADRAALARLLVELPEQWPLSAVVHCAGLVDDATLAGQSGERLRTVFAPKADAAWHLHELTREMGLSAFVLFSSAAGVLGSAGQANYAAANAFLDALAETRREQGQPALSLAWGLWDATAGMAGELDEADRRRLARTGVVAIRAEQGLAMFDEALGSEAALVVPLLLNRAALRDAAEVPAVLRGLVPAAAPELEATAREADSLRDRITGLGGEERRSVLLDAVRTEVAATLGHASPAALDARRSFTDLGFDSLTAVELRNRLTARTGLPLPASLAFDYPSPEALAAFLDGELPGATDTLLAELDRLAVLLQAETAADHEQVSERLTSLLTTWHGRGAGNGNGNGNGNGSHGIDLADTTTPEELMEFIDRNL